MNQKGLHIADLNCRFCTTNVPETQRDGDWIWTTDVPDSGGK